MSEPDRPTVPVYRFVLEMRGFPAAMTASIIKGLSHRLGLVTAYIEMKDAADG